jgi:hypothetical protein
MSNDENRKMTKKARTMAMAMARTVLQQANDSQS